MPDETNPRDEGESMQSARGLNEKVIPHKRPVPVDELQGTLRPKTFVDRIKGVLPRLMDAPKTQGVFIPSWFLAIILVPFCGGIFWVVVTLTNISRDQANIQSAIEFRLKEVEQQGKLNDERYRQLQQDFAEFRGEQKSNQRR